MVFGQLHILSLVVKNWISDDDNQFPSGNQIETIINEYIPHLRYFYCDIQTKYDVDMEVRVICQIYFSLNFFSFKTFVGLNRRWPMTYQIDPKSSSRYLYTVPRSFKVLNTSTLANIDTTNLCLRLLAIIDGVPCANLSERMSNMKTHLLQSNCENLQNFRRLRELTTMNIEILSSLTKRIHTVTLIGTSDVLTFSNIYPGVYHLVIKNTKMDSSATVTSLVKSFPNLRSLNVQFRMSNDYFDSLNGQHLPHLAMFTTNMIDQNSGLLWKINEWLFEKTTLKWRSIPFYTNSISNDQWTIWL
jgi:hypothetical protein